MDIETLKMVMDLIVKLGADGKEAFVYYILLTTLPGYIIGGITIVLGYKAVNRLILMFGSVTFEGQVADELGQYSLSTRDKRNVLRLIREHKILVKSTS